MFFYSVLHKINGLISNNLSILNWLLQHCLLWWGIQLMIENLCSWLSKCIWWPLAYIFSRTILFSAVPRFGQKVRITQTNHYCYLVRHCFIEDTVFTLGEFIAFHPSTPTQINWLNLNSTCKWLLKIVQKIMHPTYL